MILGDLVWHLFYANSPGHIYCMYLLGHFVVVLDANVITELTMALSGTAHITYIGIPLPEQLH